MCKKSITRKFLKNRMVKEKTKFNNVTILLKMFIYFFPTPIYTYTNQKNNIGGLVICLLCSLLGHVPFYPALLFPIPISLIPPISAPPDACLGKDSKV